MDDFRGEDDEFYSELRRQVLLLTEEDEKVVVGKKSDSAIFGNQRHITNLLLPRVSDFNWLENGSCDSVPAWLSSLWRTSICTGVFIPRAVKKPPRRQRSRRRNKNRNCNQRDQSICT